MKRILLLITILAFSTLLDAQVISTIAGTGVMGYNGDGITAITAKVNHPNGMAYDNAGNLYFADYSNNRIRKINASGIISTVAGNGTAGFSGDNGQATSASIGGPSSIVFDAAGNFYFTEFNNHRVRKVSTSGIITTIAGNGTSGVLGDNGLATAAELANPDYLAFDGSGNLYISQGNRHRIRKISTSGIITTAVGTGSLGYNGDGIQASTAQLNFPLGIVFDATGNLYISELNSCRIRKVNPSGIISTVVGTGTCGYNGDGIQATTAQINNPKSITLDYQGNLTIADGLNYRVRRVDAAGNITTLVGTGTAGYNGDNISPLLAQLNFFNGIVYNPAGNLIIADNFNSRIRSVNYVNGISELETQPDGVGVFPNPSTGKFSVSLAEKFQKIQVINSIGELVFEVIGNNEEMIPVEIDEAGIYFVNIISQYKTITKKVTVTK